MPFILVAEWFCNNIVWGMPTVFLFLTVGIYLSVKIKFFQFLHPIHIFKKTVGSLFKNKNNKSGKAVSQLGVISTALAATIGTGNIAGVATALTIGGAGAIFWMWVSAFLGMATAYSENLLGIYYRRKNKNGEYIGGAMYYLKEGLKAKRFLKHLKNPLAFLFAFFCIFVSFGMGNMIQVNTVTDVLDNGIFGIRISPIITAATLTLFIGFVIFGGAKRISRITEKLVPVMAFLYIFLTLSAIFINFKNIGEVLKNIFCDAFGFNSAVGGISGYAIKKALETGLKRGIFSNEAGLGSAVLVGACSEVDEPAAQGMWGIFTVFFDTVIGCSLTALAILSSGVMEHSKKTGAALVQLAFCKSMGAAAGELISVLTLLFALSTVIGWSFYGLKAAEFLLGDKNIVIYKLLFTISVIPGSLLQLETVWLIADIFNGLMALPNLIGVLALSDKVKIITDNYKKRALLGKDYTPPITSAYDNGIMGKSL